jgi:ELWxxDGT repeat protein
MQTPEKQTFVSVCFLQTQLLLPMLRTIFTTVFFIFFIPLFAQITPIVSLPITSATDLRLIGQLDQFLFFSQSETPTTGNGFWRFDASNRRIERMTTRPKAVFFDGRVTNSGIYWLESDSIGQVGLYYRGKNSETATAGGKFAGFNGQILGLAGDRIIAKAGDNIVSARPGEPTQVLGQTNNRFYQPLDWNNRVLWFDFDQKKVFSSDGTPAGTRTLGDFTQIDNFKIVGKQLIFAADKRWWRSDGTPEGTVAFLEPPTQYYTDFENGAAMGDSVLIFSARTPETGQELWRTNGTQQGTYEIKDLLSGNYPNSTFPASGQPNYFISQTGKVFFIAYDAGFNLHLWQTDGSAQGTTPLENLAQTQGLIQIFRAKKLDEGAYLFAAQTADEGIDPVLFDGRLRVYPVRPGNGSSFYFNYDSPLGSRFYGGKKVYLPVNDGQFGEELWRLDPEGRFEQFGDLAPGGAWSNPKPLGIFQDRLYWIAGNPGQQYAVYAAGTAAAPPTPPAPKTDIDWFQSIQSPATLSGSTNWVYAGGLARTKEGAVYIAGAGNGLGGRGVDFTHGAWSNPRGQNYNDLFLARLNKDGTPRWAKSIPGAHFANIGHTPIAPAPDEGVYWAGAVTGPGMLDGIPFRESGVLLARFSKEGNLLWMKPLRLGFGRVHQLCADADGNVYVAGFFYDFNADIAGTLLQSPISPAYFVAKFNPAGDLLWAKPFDANPDWPGLGPVNGMELDGKGGLYFLVGNAGQNYSAPCDFGAVFGGVLCLETQNGTKRWEQIWQGDDLWFPTDVALSPAGEVYVTGRFRGELTVGRRPLRYESADCYSTGFLAKLDSKGEVLEALPLQQEQAVAQAITFDQTGNYWLAGYSGEPDFKTIDRYDYQPFNKGKKRVFAHAYSPRNELLASRSFGVFDDFEEGGTIKMQLLDQQRVLLMGEYYGMLDTLAQGAGDGNDAQAFLLQFALPFSAKPQEPDGVLTDAKLQISPNPAQDFVFISSLDPDLALLSVELYDAAGRSLDLAVERFDFGVFRADLRHFPPGAYWLTARLGDKRITRPLVKTR